MQVLQQEHEMSFTCDLVPGTRQAEDNADPSAKLQMCGQLPAPGKPPCCLPQQPRVHGDLCSQGAAARLHWRVSQKVLDA